MKNAAQAREQCQRQLESTNQMHWEKVESAVEAAIDKGKFEVSVSLDCTQESAAYIKDMLGEYDYPCRYNYNARDSEYVFNIAW